MALLLSSLAVIEYFRDVIRAFGVTIVCGLAIALVARSPAPARRNGVQVAGPAVLREDRELALDRLLRQLISITGLLQVTLSRI